MASDAVRPQTRDADQTQNRSRATRSRTITPDRVSVDDIRTEPQRITGSRTDNRPSQRDLQRRRSVRIHTDSPRTGRDASRTADIYTRTHQRQRADGNRSDSITRRSSLRVEPASRIVVNNDNRVIVQGGPTRHRPRPAISRRLFHNSRYFSRDPHWLHYGSGFYFRWSSSSCGIVVSLPLRYTTFYYGYPYYYGSYYYGAPYYGLSYYYPRYHRKFIFVSIGGYWPYSYRYRRYYWYGCHPYYWYGANVIYDPSPNVTYNTYNYYNTDTTSDTYGYGFSGSDQPYYTLGEPKDEVVDEPEYETAADLTFDHAVKLFAAGNYDDAVEQFREAIDISPDDIILPFTYSQALFAAGDYAHAATVLRAAMANIPDEELTIYYPRGLYEDDKVLLDQIERLKTAAGNEPFASDYQLLLGYQYLGLGDLEKAHAPLVKAFDDPANKEAAGKLIELAAQLEAEAAEQAKQAETQPETE